MGYRNLSATCVTRHTRHGHTCDHRILHEDQSARFSVPQDSHSIPGVFTFDCYSADKDTGQPGTMHGLAGIIRNMHDNVNSLADSNRVVTGI
jgi:hypothetical protein